MNSRTYKGYLYSEEWKKKRTKIRRRARGWCERCKVWPRSDVHHVTYDNVGNEDESDLIGVCRTCHKFLHGLTDHDPAGVTYSKEEIEMARKLGKYYLQGIYEMVIGLCERYPEWEAVRKKMGIRIPSWVILDRILGSDK